MKNIISIIALFIFAQWCYGQDSPIRLQSITIEDGLSLSSVYCIHKDSKGFMWFGTEDGLNQFDGYHFTIYRTDVSNPNSICNKWIEHIEEDAEGNLWFGSRNGLSHFNPVTEVFTNYKVDLSNSILNDTITCLKAHANRVYIGTKDGLNTFDIATRQMRNFDSVEAVAAISVVDDEVIVAASNGLFQLINSSELSRISGFDIKAISAYQRQLYYATASALYRYNLDEGSESVIKTVKPLELIDNLEITNGEYLWISTVQGLWVHHLSKGWTKKRINAYNLTNSLAINTSKTIWVAPNGSVWYATHGDGLFIINKHFQVNKCVHNPTDKESVSQNAFNCIYADEASGSVWLGTYGAGINVYQPSANKFDLVKHNPLNGNSLPSNFVWSMWEASDSCLWIGTNDKGLSRYCPQNDAFTTFYHEAANKQSISNNSVREVFEDRKGTIWVGTDGGGLNRFNANDNSFRAYLHQADNETSLSDNSVRVIFEDSQGRLWIGTRNGLNQFDVPTGTFKRYQHDARNSRSISNNFIYASIIEDRQGNLWIGTYGGGLNRFNPDTEVFEHYTTALEAGHRLSNDIVFCIYEDAKGLLWIGTNEGLNILNPVNGVIEVLGAKDGLPNEVIYSILPDENGMLWMSTNYGICCIDPVSRHCRNYDVSDGLQSNEFNGGAFHKGHSGKLYFGGVYGLNILNPKVLTENTYVNRPVITRLEVLGNEVHTLHNGKLLSDAVAEVDSQYVLPTNISYTQKIELDYSQRFFAIEYSGLNHLTPSKTQYAFQLSPLDKKWNKAGNRNYVSFANIEPGDYEFKVISTNSDGVWCDEPAVLHITIRPPFWQSAWFVLLELIVLALFVVFVYRFLLKIRTNKLLKEQNEEIKEANHQLHLSEENLKHMNATKDKFFSIISHDLKNPFTSLMSISGMLDENYEETDDEDKRHAVTRINNSVTNIYSLLENLLTWSRSQRGKICFSNDDFDISALVAENINLYRTAAEKKGIKLINQIEEKVLAHGDRNTINTVIRNLTGNAVKFTSSGGTVTYTITDSDTYWKVGIKDSGVGISAENQKYLFRIDKKHKTEGTEGEKGTGLGLIICKEFVEKNNGQIGVISEESKGAEFWFTVPKGHS